MKSFFFLSIIPEAFKRIMGLLVSLYLRPVGAEVEGGLVGRKYEEIVVERVKEERRRRFTATGRFAQ